MSYQSSPLVDAYLKGYSGETKKRLVKLRASIQRLFPHTIEDISYGMPTYRPAPKKRGIVHFACFGDHIGLYAVFDPENNPILHDKLKPYRTGKGTLQFKHSDPFPVQLIDDALIHHAAHLHKK